MRPGTSALFAAMLALLGACGAAQYPATEELAALVHENASLRRERATLEREAREAPNRRITEARLSDAAYAPAACDPAAHDRNGEEHFAHRSANRPRASDLRELQARECREIPRETRETCPLLLGAERIEDVRDGVRVVLAPDVDVDATAQLLECHLAFAVTEGREGTEGCALYVHGARVEASGHDVLLTTTDPSEVAELRRRARAQTR